MKMSSVNDQQVTSLRRQEFPSCTTNALKIIVQLLSAKSKSTAVEEYCSHLAREFVFFELPMKNGQLKKLGPIQHLQLQSVIVDALVDKEQSLLFSCLFNAELHDRRKACLHQLVSMSIGIENSQLLNLVSMWMQMKGCGSIECTYLAESIVQDYILINANNLHSLKYLPKVSKLFTCCLLTTITTLYSPENIPEHLISLIIEWLNTEADLCLTSLLQSYSQRSLWTSPSKSNTLTPVVGIARWCTQAPLRIFKMSANEALRWSRLHHTVLVTLQHFPNVPGANQMELITLSDMNRLFKEIIDMKSGVAEEQISLTMIRLGQLLQVSLATGAFRCSLNDLQHICQSAPTTRLFNILGSRHLANTPPPMHYE